MIPEQGRVFEQIQYQLYGELHLTPLSVLSQLFKHIILYVRPQGHFPGYLTFVLKTFVKAV